MPAEERVMHNCNSKMKTNMLPFKGMLSIDIPMNNGFKISLLKWESTPTKYNAFSEIWITDNQERKTCYIDPGEAKEIFDIYHSFDEVVPVKLHWTFKNKNELEVTVESMKIKISLTTRQSTIERMVNLILGTCLKGIFRKSGRTETNMSFNHQPHKVELIESAVIEFGQNVSARLVSDSRCMISWCTHYLEEYGVKT